MDDGALFDSLTFTREQLLKEIGRVVVGQSAVVELMLTALLSDGHCLFVGVPGLAKTLLVNTLADVVGIRFGRIQFTPDLMPSDITGTEILEEDRATGQRKLRFVHGPLFTNLLLADEINRTPPKTQAALLQAMQERAVTAAGHTYELERPFLVFATQNPIEQEGTYPLPEAQQDRFMFSIPVGYPNAIDEQEIVRRTTVGELPRANRVLDVAQLKDIQALLRRLPLSDEVVRTSVRLSQATRPGDAAAAGAARWLRWGAGPRASQYLAIGARTRAALNGHEVATTEDILAVAGAVLRHRVIPNFEAEATNMDVDTIIRNIINEVI